GKIFRQRLADLGHHVAVAVARVVAGHLLQGDDIRAAHGVGDAADIVFAVEADAILDVIGDEPHSGTPTPRRTAKYGNGRRTESFAICQCVPGVPKSVCQRFRHKTASPWAPPWFK